MKRYLVLVLVLLVLAPLARGQSDLRRLARDAGQIFSGTVEHIEHVAPAARGDIGLVRVTFRVRHALRGVSPGTMLTIREWDGLWSSGDRYRVGENLLLFLYKPSGSLGLTTTVGGPQGRISLSDSQLSIADLARQLAEPASNVPEEPGPKPLPRCERARPERSN